MSAPPSKTQIDRLGDRLKKGRVSDADLETLDTYRRTFVEAYEAAVSVLRDRLKVRPTGRPAKSTRSIADKLRREHVRLTQIQDIAGCRVIVRDVVEQDRLTKKISTVFADSQIVDRRKNPSHGYRAIHVIVKLSGKPVELQIRTSIQHLWAELSEKLSDLGDPEIKYGRGPEHLNALLAAASSLVEEAERLERHLQRLRNRGGRANKLSGTEKKALKQRTREGRLLRTNVVALFREILEGAADLVGGNDLSN